MAELDVILPAGGILKTAIAEHTGIRNKALLPVGGQTLLHNVMQAVKGIPGVRRIVLVGDEDVRAHPDAQDATDFLTAGLSSPENILKAMQHLGSAASERVLIVTTDLPFITADILTDFIARTPIAADFAVPIHSRADFARTFPGIENTYIPLADGQWTAGCAYMIRPDGFARALPHIESVFQQRKSPLGMAKLLGPGFLVKFLARRLTVPQVLAKVESIIECKGAPVEGASPALAFDIDNDEDYQNAVRELMARGR